MKEIFSTESSKANKENITVDIFVFVYCNAINDFQ